MAIGAALLNIGFTFAAQQSVQSPTSDAGAKVSDSELRAFAKVYTEYQDITRQYQPALNNAKDAAASKKIQDEAFRCKSITQRLLELKHRDGKTCEEISGRGKRETRKSFSARAYERRHLQPNF